MSSPLIGRPKMPGYGVPESNDGALPWSWAEERLVTCRNYFVVTTRPSGRPHVMPVWGCWIDGRFLFSTSMTSVKSKNLQGNPNCVVNVDDGQQAVIVEGVAKIVELDEVPDFADAYKEKYDYEIEAGPLWAIEPRAAFGFIEDDSFAETATKWRWKP